MFWLTLSGLLLSACAREIPPHLRVEAPAASSEAAPIASETDALAALLRGDPLARRPALLDDAQLVGISEAEALKAWLELAREAPETAAPLQALAAQAPGTVAVGLSRGWRLGRVEATTPSLLAEDRAAWRDALLWLSALGPAPELSAGRSPWAWLPQGERPVEDMLAYGEAWVLRGWLDGPDVPVGPVVEALQATAYDRLALSPEGRLLRARMTPNAAPADLTALDRLVDLWLERAAADRDSEQEAHRARCEALAVELGLEEEGRLPDPLPALAEQVFEGYAASGTPDATGAALTAWSLRRWAGGCAGCAGLDRGATLGAVERWSDALAPRVAAARLAMLKDAVDRFEVGLKHNRMGESAVRLADALLGTGAGPIDVTFLERGAPAPGTWLTLTRATGAPDGATPEDGLAALRAWLAAQADRVAEDPAAPEAWKTWAARIARRAR
ncbi:MAG: hypothetical protein H6739_25135 [Alphaproteobacteria bacterium]|nr:hypothetical protein [Alphaproteobacteria bacterium]